MQFCVSMELVHIHMGGDSHVIQKKQQMFCCHPEQCYASIVRSKIIWNPNGLTIGVMKPTLCGLFSRLHACWIFDSCTEIICRWFTNHINFNLIWLYHIVEQMLGQSLAIHLGTSHWTVIFINQGESFVIMQSRQMVSCLTIQHTCMWGKKRWIGLHLPLGLGTWYGDVSNKGT